MTRKITICDSTNFVDKGTIKLEISKSLYGEFFLDEAEVRKYSKNGKISYSFGQIYEFDKYQNAGSIKTISGILAIYDDISMDDFNDQKEKQHSDGVFFHPKKLELYIAGFLEVIFARRNWNFDDSSIIRSIQTLSSNLITWVGLFPNDLKVYIHTNDKGIINSIILDNGVIFNYA